MGLTQRVAWRRLAPPHGRRSYVDRLNVAIADTLRRVKWQWREPGLRLGAELHGDTSRDETGNRHPAGTVIYFDVVGWIAWATSNQSVTRPPCQVTAPRKTRFRLRATLGRIGLATYRAPKGGFMS